MSDPTRTPFDADHGDDDLDADLLADLRAAWGSQPVPEATPDLDDADPLTRAAVDWMTRAYQAQQPALAGPSLPVRHRWHQGWRRWRRQAVAAVLLIGLGLAVAHGPERETASRDDEPAAPLADAGQPATPSRPDDDAERPVTPTRAGPARPAGDLAATDEAAPTSDGLAPSPTDHRATPARDEPRLVAVADDHVAFRAGAVRLVLITNPASAE